MRRGKVGGDEFFPQRKFKQNPLQHKASASRYIGDTFKGIMNGPSPDDNHVATVPSTAYALEDSFWQQILLPY